MKLVIIESPFAGKTDEETQLNIDYARKAVADCLKRGESPYASHLFFTQPGILDDKIPGERTLGIEAGLAWGDKAEVTIVYVDRGISSGMRYGIARAESINRPIIYRKLDDIIILHDGDEDET